MDKKLLGLSLAFFVTFILFMVAIVFQQPITQAIRATEDTAPSGSTSLIFAWPLSEKADGQTQVRVDVFVRSQTNRPVAKRVVSVSSSLGQVEPTVRTTDDTGKASFTITSSSPGVAQLSATIDNTIPLQRQLSVKFE